MTRSKRKRPRTGGRRCGLASLRRRASRHLRVQLDDILAAALDATAPPGRRTLGRREARRQIVEAARKCEAIFALARRRP